jgi:hypothetical protein
MTWTSEEVSVIFPVQAVMDIQICLCPDVELLKAGTFEPQFGFNVDKGQRMCVRRCCSVLVQP